MNTENITRSRWLDLNTVLYSGSAYQSQGSSAAGHWINTINTDTEILKPVYTMTVYGKCETYLSGQRLIREIILRRKARYKQK